MSDKLLEIIARLQWQHVSLAEGRYLLLDYARKRAGTSLGMLFLLDPNGQRLLLVEQCGRAPHRTPASDTVEITVDGLFGLALHRYGLVNISEGYHHPRALPAERAWIWPNGHILLCVVGLSAEADVRVAASEQGPRDRRRGVMVLCAEPHTSTPPAPPSKQAEQDILLCSALLGSYLDEPDAHSTDAEALAAGVGTRGDHALVARRQVAFYETWLVSGTQDRQAMYRRVVDTLREELDAVGGQLWLYVPSHRQFVLRASSGEDSSEAATLIGDQLAQIGASLRQGGQEENLGTRAIDAAQHMRGPRVLTWSPEKMVVLHLLEYTGQPVSVAGIVGAVAFIVKGRQGLSKEQRLLLEQMCRAAAVIVQSWQVRAAERQAAINAERSRIARDIHDGAAQQIAQAIHMLEYAGRIAAKQPPVARQEIGQARKILVESLNSLRQSIASLLPVPLEQAGLGKALAAMLDEFRSNNPAIDVQYEGAPIKHWPLSLEVPIYRLLQEALQNIRKHAHATRVTVRLQASTGMIVVQVSDNGAGFDIDQIRSSKGEQRLHFGLRSMQERVEQARGTFTLTSKPGEGTIIKASFPLPARAVALTSREREVLRLLVEGASNRAIAERLSVSVETVKSHVHHIMQKLGVKDRTQAAVLAARQQWV